MKTLCTVLMLCGACFAATPPDMPVDCAESSFQKRNYHCVLMESHLEDAPSWDSEKNPPPLSAKKAVSLALSDIAARLGRHPFWASSPGWELHQVSLVAVHASNVWYYRISLKPMVPGSGLHPSVTVFVTLDGKVVPLTEKK